MIILLVIVIIVFLAIFKSTIIIVPQGKVYLTERFGKYERTLEPGINILAPFIDRVSKKVDLREQVFNFDPQPVITRDNVTMMIDTVIYIHIINPYDYYYSVSNPNSAVENLTATTLRNIVGDLELDETLTSRDIVNTKIRATLDSATEKWGMRISRVEVKNITPPKDIQDAMEKQMRAEREKREKILTAEGLKISQITEAEGSKESNILKAEGLKASVILKAEAEAQKIELVQNAYAKALERLNEANPNEAVLKLKGFEALEKVADGKATKLIIPSEMQKITSLASVVKETWTSDENK